MGGGDSAALEVPLVRKGAFNHNPVAQLRARDLRSEMSVSEKRLWAWLRKDQTGFRFRRQVRVEKFFLDFYCAAAKLCVEVDGEQHAVRREQDAFRDRILFRRGIETVRIPSLDLFQDDTPKFNDWINRIVARCQERAESPTPNPLPQRRTTLREGAPEPRS